MKERINERIAELGLTYSDLVGWLGHTGVCDLARFLVGEKKGLSIGTIERLAHALQSSVAYIVRGE